MSHLVALEASRGTLPPIRIQRHKFQKIPEQESWRTPTKKEYGFQEGGSDHCDHYPISRNIKMVLIFRIIKVSAKSHHLPSHIIHQPGL